jgi:hypothetical protein
LRGRARQGAHCSAKRCCSVCHSAARRRMREGLISPDFIPRNELIGGQNRAPVVRLRAPSASLYLWLTAGANIRALLFVRISIGGERDSTSVAGLSEPKFLRTTSTAGKSSQMNSPRHAGSRLESPRSRIAAHESRKSQQSEIGARGERGLWPFFGQPSSKLRESLESLFQETGDCGRSLSRRTVAE